MTKSILLFDCGDLIFNTFFKSYNNYLTKLKRDCKELNENTDLSLDEDFFQIIRKTFLGITKRVRYKYNVPYNNTFYIRDSPIEMSWRKKIYPEYKSHRTTTKYKKRSFNLSSVFKRMYAEVLPEIAEKFKIKILQIDKAEADDTISVIIRDLPKHTMAYVISSDTDYLQLLNRPKTFIYSLNNEFVNTKLNDKSAREKLLEKIIYGDKSDNIPSCMSSIDSVKVKEYLNNPVELMILLTNNKVLLSKFNQNRKLIDFDCIPDEIRNKIICGYKTLLKNYNYKI